MGKYLQAATNTDRERGQFYTFYLFQKLDFQRKITKWDINRVNLDLWMVFHFMKYKKYYLDLKYSQLIYLK